MLERGNLKKTSPPGECKHCKLPFAEQVQEDGFTSEEFCCAGCQAVYSLIHDLNLDAFYQHRDNSRATLSPANQVDIKFEHFDDQIFIERATQAVKGGLAITLGVQRIHCSACIWLLERLPRRLSGVLSMRASLSNSTLEVVFNPGEIKLSIIAQELSRFGYYPYELSELAELAAQKAYERDFLMRLGVAGFCAGNTMLLAICLYQGYFTGIEQAFGDLFRWVSLAFALPAMLFSAVPFYRGAWSGLKVGIIHIDFPISLGIIVGFVASVFATFQSDAHVYYDTLCILIFFLLAGRWLQYRMLKKAEAGFTILEVLPSAAVKLVDNKPIECLVDRIQIGEIVQVKANQRIALDGILESAEGWVNNAHLTGESRPIKVVKGDIVFAGAINLTSEINFKVQAKANQTRLGKVLTLMHKSIDQRPILMTLTTRLSYLFTIVVIATSLVTLFVVGQADLSEAVKRVVALLVITCPCALGLSAPLAASLSITKAAAKGILIKRADVFEKAVAIKQVAFDKTGTLTNADCKIQLIFSSTGQQDINSSVRQYGALLFALEQNIEHPLARAICEAINTLQPSVANSVYLKNLACIAGKGVEAHDDRGNVYRIGKVNWALGSCLIDLVWQHHLEELDKLGLSQVLLTKNNLPVLLLGIGDTLAQEAPSLFVELNKNNVKFGVISGDSVAAVSRVIEDIGQKFDFAHAELSPEEKLAIVKDLNTKEALMMVGDGINDAAALGAASLGVAVRGGVEACLESADVFIGSGKLLSITNLLESSKQTLLTVKRNIVIAIAYNVVGGLLSIFGFVNPLVAAILMPISSASIVLSSSRNKAFKD